MLLWAVLQICFLVVFQIIISILKGPLFTLVVNPTPHSCTVTKANTDTGKGWWYWVSVEGIFNSECGFASPGNEEEPARHILWDSLGTHSPASMQHFQMVFALVLGCLSLSAAWEEWTAPSYWVVWTIECEGGSEHLGITRFSLTAILLLNLLSQECGGQHFFSHLCQLLSSPCSLRKGKRKHNPFHLIHN